MIQKVTKVKLGAFVAITAVVLTVMALNYVRLPQQVGIGRYGVDVELASAGGLYPQAAVTYRGVEVGKVTDVDLRPGGLVVARLQVDDKVAIPRDSVAEVRSSSVIGEQYLNFVPTGEAGAPLEDGATVPVEQTRLPTTTHALLTSVDDLLGSLPLKDLRTAVREAGAATNGVGNELGGLISDSRAFQREASRNLPATIKLLEDAGPVLRTQQALDPNIRSFAHNLDSLTGELVAADSQLRGVLAVGAPFMRQVGTFADDLRPVLPGMLAELADTGEVLNVYRDNVEHVLILLPAVVPTLLATIPANQRTRLRNAANLYFKTSLNPPPCTVGFKDGGRMRDPSDITTVDPSPTDWCKVPALDPRAPRGARNHTCPNSGRAATARACGLIFDESVVAPRGLFTEGGRSARSGTSGSADGSELGFLSGGSRTNPTSLSQLLTGLVGP